MGVGVRVGKGVIVGMGVGVRRGGTSVIARLRHILVTTSKLKIEIMMRVRRSLARCKVPPVSDCCLLLHYSTAVRRHKHGLWWGHPTKVLENSGGHRQAFDVTLTACYNMASLR